MRRSNEDRVLYCKTVARKVGGCVGDQLKPAPYSLAEPRELFLGFGVGGN